MRLWTLHPVYLDTKGLLALWREGLLAQKVLLGQTKGYRNHPQLRRFKAHDDPAGAIGVYLCGVCDEADRRAYSFNRSKIVKDNIAGCKSISATRGQLAYEVAHLRKKLEKRDPVRLEDLKDPVRPHSLFEIVPGDIEAWEIV